MDELVAADMGVDLKPRNTVIEVSGWVGEWMGRLPFSAGRPSLEGRKFHFAPG